MDELIKDSFEKAKYIAIRYVKDIDLAEEIAQLSSIQLFLNYGKIEKSKINCWLFTVTRNLCMDLYRKNKKDLEIFVDPVELSESSIIQAIEDEEQLDIDVYDFISEADKKLLKKYYYQNIPISKLARDFKIKVKQLKQKIYSLENEIKLYHLVNSDVVYFKLVPTTKLTKQVNNFIKALIKALEKSDFVSMKRYCKDAIIHKSIENIKIKSYEACKIKVIEKDKYQIIIGYLDYENQIKVFNIKFTITKSGNIQVLEMPIIPKRVLVLDKKYIDPKSSVKELLNRKGLYNNKLGSIDEMKDKGIAKVIQTEDDFGK